jgi:hypothetical protein
MLVPLPLRSPFRIPRERFIHIFLSGRGSRFTALSQTPPPPPLFATRLFSRSKPFGRSRFRDSSLSPPATITTIDFCEGGSAALARLRDPEAPRSQNNQSTKTFLLSARTPTGAMGLSFRAFRGFNSLTSPRRRLLRDRARLESPGRVKSLQRLMNSNLNLRLQAASASLADCASGSLLLIEEDCF